LQVYDPDVCIRVTLFGHKILGMGISKEKNMFASVEKLICNLIKNHDNSSVSII